jgi:hypothetical protein
MARSRIDVTSAKDLAYWSDYFCVDATWLRAAVGEVGPNPAAVRDHLRACRLAGRFGGKASPHLTARQSRSR